MTQIQSDILGWMNAAWKVVYGGSSGPGHVLGAGGEVFCGRTNRFLLFWHVLALRVVRVWLGGRCGLVLGILSWVLGLLLTCHRQAEGTGLWSSSFFPVCAFVTAVKNSGEQEQSAS